MTSSPSYAEVRHAALTYLGQRYPDWTWAAQEEVSLFGSAGTIMGVAQFGTQRYAVQFPLPRLPHVAREDALTMLYAWLDEAVWRWLKKDALTAEEVEDDGGH